MALSPYPDSIDLGTWPYERRYVRRIRELVVLFDATLDLGFDGQTHHLLSLGLHPRVFEHDQRFDGLHAAGMRWIDNVEEDVPGGLRRVARELAETGSIVHASPVYRPEDADEWDAAIPLPGDLLIRIPDRALEEAIAALKGLDLVYEANVSGFLEGGQRFFRLASGRPRDDGFGFEDEHPRPLFDAVLAVAGVKAVEHDWVRLMAYDAFPVDAPHDEFFGGQWSLRKIEMLGAWRRANAAEGVPVAVIDSGFDLDHPDLNFHPTLGLDAEDLWLNGNETSDAGPSSFAHGTAVAGVAGAKVDNDLRKVGGVDVGVGVASVGTGCPIVPIRLGDTPSSGRLAIALAWARAKQVRIASMSLTVVETSTAVSEIDAAGEAGMLLCAATGNMPPGFGAASVGFPARHLYVIGVGASDRDDHRYDGAVAQDGQNWQSRYGTGVDVVAPGVGIWTTDERQGPGAGFNPPAAGWAIGGNGEPRWFGGDTAAGVGFGPDTDYLAVFSGTSSATPQVAGLASLILAIREDLSAEGVRNLIERTCDMPDVYARDLEPHPKRIGGPDWNVEVGCGRINADAALADIAADPPLPTIPLHPDPCEGAEQVVLQGFVGRGPGTQWRIYATRTLDRWTEVERKDIVGADQLPLAGSRVFVRPGAKIRRVIVTHLTAGSAFTPR